MKPQRRYFGFRDDAIKWIRDNGFYYVDFFGWCHADGYVASVEFVGSRTRPWALCVYKSAIPNRQRSLPL